MKKRAPPEKDENFYACRENRKRRSGARTPKLKREPRAEIADTVWNDGGTPPLLSWPQSLVNMFGVLAGTDSPGGAPRQFRWLRRQPEPNDIARFLAGMPVPENSPLAPLTRDPAWQAHSAFFEGEFSKLFQRQLQKLHVWTATNFPEVHAADSGRILYVQRPGFFTSINFSLNASVYMHLRERINGTAARSLRIPNLSGALGNLENAMRSSLKNVLITQHMKVDLQQPNLNGVLPILNVSRARKQIDHERHVWLAEQ